MTSQPPKKTKVSDTTHTAAANPAKVRRKVLSFKTEWLAQSVQIDGQHVQLGDIFSFSEEKGVICKTCCEAKVSGDFSEGKKWDEWKMDYLKRHLLHKTHQNAAGILRRRNRVGIGELLLQNEEERRDRNEQLQKNRSDSQQVKVLIDNVLLGIQMNASMLSVQQIHDHVAKYVSIPEHWRSKNYAFEFVKSINAIVQNESMCNIRNAPFHTLIVDESTDITVHKMLVLYIKYREAKDVNYKTEFGGIIQLKSCTAPAIVEAITQFYSKHELDMQRMVMLTSDGASVF